MIAHESLLHSKEVAAALRACLYTQLAQIDKVSQQQICDRYTLRDITNNLHNFSQHMDSLIVSAETGVAIATSMEQAHTRFRSILDSIAYLRDSFSAQKRWLESYQHRKNIAMNSSSSILSPNKMPRQVQQ
ncbi:hypothetical protein BJ508DRAFT_339536 [Ascobolus immersus RN42]|uniref:Uncharacterized protein n=1 Tax=Ascobolus immersus RN42 TaxID=1160509 RepID=A0A3N4HT44_ASCIM|nr:hypothetical protein BJ508DRAFT_339536 [Ascobolus immersus RN42]